MKRVVFETFASKDGLWILNNSEQISRMLDRVRELVDYRITTIGFTNLEVVDKNIRTLMDARIKLLTNYEVERSKTDLEKYRLECLSSEIEKTGGKEAINTRLVEKYMETLEKISESDNLIMNQNGVADLAKVLKK